MTYANGVTTSQDYANVYDALSSALVSGSQGAVYQAGYTYLPMTVSSSIV